MLTSILFLISFFAFSSSSRFELCETLTNPEVKKAEGYVLDERKPIMQYHVRHLCEEANMRGLEGKTSKDLEAELQLIHDSFIDRHRIEKGVGLIDILKMGLTNDLSPYLLRVKKSTYDNKPVSPSSLWKPPYTTPSRAFDEQVKALSVDPDFEYAVIDKLEGKGSAAKIHVNDMKNGNRWLLKWGDEIHTDPVASRLFAGLGYNVDLPFYKSQGSLKVLLGKNGNRPREVRELVNFIFNSYKINLSPFIAKIERLSNEMISSFPLFEGHEGEYLVTFTGVALEPRVPTEARLGGLLYDHSFNQNRRELKGALLAHLWIGNWDTKEDNTMWSVHQNKNGTELVGVISDLGLSLGVHLQKFPRDIKTGLPNFFGWDIVVKTNGEIKFLGRMNYIPEIWRNANYSDLRWMALQIARFSREEIENIVQEKNSGWPAPIRQLYTEKLLHRRKQILEAFDVQDPWPTKINRELTFPGIVEKGELLKEIDLKKYPEGFFRKEGRFRRFGW